MRMALIKAIVAAALCAAVSPVRAEVRILASARTSPRSFDLRCEVREKLIAFLQKEHPYALPRLRMERGERPGAQALTEARLAAE